MVCRVIINRGLGLGRGEASECNRKSRKKGEFKKNDFFSEKQLRLIVALRHRGIKSNL